MYSLYSDFTDDILRKMTTNLAIKPLIYSFSYELYLKITVFIFLRVAIEIPLLPAEFFVS